MDLNPDLPNAGQLCYPVTLPSRRLSKWILLGVYASHDGVLINFLQNTLWGMMAWCCNWLIYLTSSWGLRVRHMVKYYNFLIINFIIWWWKCSESVSIWLWMATYVICCGFMKCDCLVVVLCNWGRNPLPITLIFIYFWLVVFNLI
jgi:hypothetical protein